MHECAGVAVFIVSATVAMPIGMNITPWSRSSYTHLFNRHAESVVESNSTSGVLNVVQC